MHSLNNNLLKLLPLEYDGLDMTVIRQQQQLEFTIELKLLAQHADSDYTVIYGVLYDPMYMLHITPGCCYQL